MRALIALMFILASGAVLAQQAEIPPEKEVILYQSKKLGTVTFLHKHHSTLSKVECRTCHHTLNSGEEPKPCHECHFKGAKDVPEPKKAFHLRCTECHEYTTEKGLKAGPIKKKCKLCHVKPKKGKEQVAGR